MNLKTMIKTTRKKKEKQPKYKCCYIFGIFYLKKKITLDYDV